MSRVTEKPTPRSEISVAPFWGVNPVFTSYAKSKSSIEVVPHCNRSLAVPLGVFQPGKWCNISKSTCQSDTSIRISPVLKNILNMTNSEMDRKINTLWKTNLASEARKKAVNTHVWKRKENERQEESSASLYGVRRQRNFLWNGGGEEGGRQCMLHDNRPSVRNLPTPSCVIRANANNDVAPAPRILNTDISDPYCVGYFGLSPVWSCSLTSGRLCIVMFPFSLNNSYKLLIDFALVGKVC